jgi:hypothetical protein
MTSASVTVIRALNKLKTVLKRDGITAAIEAPGTSGALLCVIGSPIKRRRASAVAR